MSVEGVSVTDLFLSYKAEDRPRVAPLVEALESDGLSVWWDAHIGGGDDWRETILRHLEAARCVIVIWSRRSVGPNGNFVRDEATRAQKRKTYFPLRIDKVDPPLGFGETQALDLTGWKGDRTDPRYQAVLGALRKRLGIRNSSSGAKARAEGLDRRTILVGTGAAAALSVAGAGAWFLSRPARASGNSIAVLPFANLSGDPNQSYFSDGIAEELRSALSRIAGLKVVARTSSEAVRDEDAKTAAAKLAVDNILTGSVRRSPDTIRVSAQLIDGKQGIEQWSQSYDRPTGDALKIQTDIADRVAEALSLQIGTDAGRQAEGGTVDAAAQDLLLKAQAIGRVAIDRPTLQRALALVDSAIALDPRFADAYAAKALMLAAQAGSMERSAAQSRATYHLAELNAREAIKLAPRARFGYSALGITLDQQLHRRAAFDQFRKMESLPGSDADSLLNYAVFLGEIGRSKRAIELADVAIDIDPLSPIARGIRIYVLAAARRYDEAWNALEEASRLSPQRYGSPTRRGHLLTMMGRNREAMAQFAKIDLDQANPIAKAEAAIVAARLGDRAKSEALLAQISHSDGTYFQQADVLAQQGKPDEALDALEKAFEQRDSGLTTTLIDPYLDPLRGDPRFQAFFRKLDFPT
jgi:serine/threonine-protein kinase